MNCDAHLCTSGLSLIGVDLDEVSFFQTTAGKACDRSRSAIYVELEKGRLPKPLKLGRRLYWESGALDQYLTALQEDQNA